MGVFKFVKIPFFTHFEISKNWYLGIFEGIEFIKSIVQVLKCNPNPKFHSLEFSWNEKNLTKGQQKQNKNKAKWISAHMLQALNFANFSGKKFSNNKIVAPELGWN